MIWVQPPGTASGGHLFLDAYPATGDEFYYTGAERLAGAIFTPSTRLIFRARPRWKSSMQLSVKMRGDLKSSNIITATQLLMMQEPQKLQNFCCACMLKNVIQHIALYSIRPSILYWLVGGWPQRFPLMHNHSNKDHGGYSSYTTNLYKGSFPSTQANNDYAATMVGDKWDTSPYPVDNPVMGICTGA